MAGIDAFGTQWQIEDDVSVGVYNTIARVTSIDMLDVDVDDLDMSSHDSTGQWREFAAGMKDGGELSFDLNFTPAQHADLLDLVGATKLMKIVLPADADDAVVAFSGYIKGLSGAAPFDDKLEASVTVKVSGAVTITIP